MQIFPTLLGDEFCVCVIILSEMNWYNSLPTSYLSCKSTTISGFFCNNTILLHPPSVLCDQFAKVKWWILTSTSVSIQKFATRSGHDLQTTPRFKILLSNWWIVCWTKYIPLRIQLFKVTKYTMQIFGTHSSCTYMYCQYFQDNPTENSTHCVILSKLYTTCMSVEFEII